LLYFFSSGVAFLIVLVKLQFDRLFGSARRPAGFAGHRAGSTEEAKATATMR